MDGRADLYSLGCVLFEMLVGRPPFEFDAAALTYAHVHRPAPRTRSIAPAVPERLDSLVAALLEKEPSARPQSAAEVQAILERATEKDGLPTAIPTEPLSAIEHTRRLPDDRSSRPPIEARTSPEPTKPSPAKRPPAPSWIGPVAATALSGLLLFVLLPVLFTGDPSLDGGTGARSPTSPPATNESEPPAEPPSPQEAAQRVFAVVNRGIAAREITGGIVTEIPRKVDEAFRELEEHQDLEKALDKIG